MCWSIEPTASDVALHAICVRYRSTAFCIDRGLLVCGIRAGRGTCTLFYSGSCSTCFRLKFLYKSFIFSREDWNTRNKTSFSTIRSYKKIQCSRHWMALKSYMGAVQSSSSAPSTGGPEVPPLLRFGSWGTDGPDTDWWLLRQVTILNVEKLETMN